MSIINKIKKIDNSLIKNFFSLTLLQFSNYIASIATVPYLYRILGTHYFGILAIATAIVYYLAIITDYGFNFIATKQTSIHRENKKKIVEIYSSVITIKLFLCLICFVAMVIGLKIYGASSIVFNIYLLSFGFAIGHCLFSTWFFQGIEEMQTITIINSMTKTLGIVLIYIFVKSQNDVLLAPAFTSLGYLSSGIISVFVIRFKYKIKFSIQKLATIIDYFKLSWDIFLSNFCIILYRNANVIILGYFTNTTVVAAYSVAEKTIKAVLSLQNMFSSACFPYLSRIFNQNKNSAVEMKQKFFPVIFITYLIFALILFMLTPICIYYITGRHDAMATDFMRIMTSVILFGGINYVIGTLGLIPLGFNKFFSRSVISIGIFSIAMTLLLSWKYNGYGASIIFSTSELILFFILYFKINAISKNLIKNS